MCVLSSILAQEEEEVAALLQHAAHEQLSHLDDPMLQRTGRCVGVECSDCVCGCNDLRIISCAGYLAV